MEEIIEEDDREKIIEVEELLSFIERKNQKLKKYIEYFCKEQLDEYFSNEIDFIEDYF